MSFTDPRLMAESLSRAVAAHVDEFVVSVDIVDSVMVKYANGEISVTQSWRDYVVGAYMTKGGRISMSTYTTSDPGEAIKATIPLIDKLAPSPFHAPLPQPGGSPLSSVDSKIREASLSGDPGGIVEEVDVRGHGNVAGMILLKYSRNHYIGSNGLDMGYEVTKFNGYFRVFKGEESGQWAWVSTAYEPRLALKSLEKAWELASLCYSLPKVKVESGKYRVLLSPMVAGNLLEDVASAASAGSAIMGLSFLQGRKPGDVIASEKLTLKEVPRAENMPGLRGFDDEGVATRDKSIIERGVFKGFIHNTKTARLMNAESTGNAGWLMPRLFNLEVDPGTLEEGELLEVLGNGIYATNNWYTRFQNYLEGSFSTVTRDALIVVENGKPSGCYRRARLTGTLPKLIESVEELSRERWPIEWWEVSIPTLLPHMLVSEMGVTAATSPS
ncbi:MAG: TldD/PmbA family protein [Thermoprotei archaeon]|nr:TldD/PmbA family protein [Thermoprotei archaeon]